MRNFASNLFKMQFRFKFIHNASLFNNKMFQNVRHIQDYYKPLHYLIISLVAYLDWVVLNSP